MTNQEKLEKLKEWLKENNIPFEENHKSRSTGFTFDLRVKKPLIAVCISSEKDNEIKNLSEHIDYLQHVIDETRKSMSYKIGLAVTELPRKLRKK